MTIVMAKSFAFVKDQQGASIFAPVKFHKMISNPSACILSDGFERLSSHLFPAIPNWNPIRAMPATTCLDIAEARCRCNETRDQDAMPIGKMRQRVSLQRVTQAGSPLN